MGLINTLNPASKEKAVRFKSLFLNGLQIKKNNADTIVNEKSNSGVRLKLDIKNEGSIDKNNIARADIVLDTNTRQIL
jgi:hypothetical protein